MLLLQVRFRLVQGQISTFASDSPTNKFLVVLDAAQFLRDYGGEYFVPRADSVDPRPILSPIIQGLRKISAHKQDYCVVTCGAYIGEDEIQFLGGGGGIGENLDQFDRQIIDFPGWESEDQVSNYINNIGDLLSEHDRSRLHTLIPKEAVQE
ncbi:hypothetical protein DFQ29_003233, partial [Apophysomyces sp. BC1021]